MRIAVVVLMVATLSGCGARAGSEDQLLVSAAASLTDAFTAIEGVFEEANPGVDVVLNLAGSSALREQILAGAPAAVFASANVSNMSRVASAGETVGDPRIFARNRLQIAVPAGNPAGVENLDDFADESLFIGLCAEDVPCGDLARRALDAAGVTPSIDTNEPDVRSLLTKVGAGELDAGIVYVTDVVASDVAIEGIDIPEGINVVASYSIAVLSGAADRETAGAFIDFVLSEEGQSLLTRFGFDSP